MSGFSLSTYDDAYLIKFFVTIVRSHPLGQALIKESIPWTQLGDRRFYLEAVSFDLLSKGYAVDSMEWADTLHIYAYQYEDAGRKATEYALREDASILEDYLNYRVPYYLWTSLTSKMNPNRLKALMERAWQIRINEQAREDAEERAEAYADF
jgi:hypothetical protein